MNLRSTILLVPLLLFVSLLHCYPAGAAADEESLWLTALSKFERGRYKSAITDLQGIISSPYSNYRVSALLLLGKCYLHEKDLKDASKTAHRLIDQYPHSKYAPHAHYLLGEVAFLQKDYFESAWQLLTTAQTTDDNELNALARRKLAGIFESYLNNTERESLLKWVTSRRIQDELKSVQQGFKFPIKIGVILELSGPNAAIGGNVLSGIEAAFEAVRKKIPHDIALITRDSGGNVIEAVKAAQDLIANDGVIALIGGLHGPCTAAIAAVASEENVPLIVPAAQDNGLANIGEGVFQLMADYRLEGMIAAAYARSDLEAEKAVILAPASEAANQRVEGFTAQFENHGGEVVLVQWYYQGASNYKRQLDQFIQIGAARLGEDFELDEEQVQKLIDWDEEPEEELYFLEEYTEEVEADTLLDSLLGVYGSPINYFDVLYIPIEGEEISLLTPQVAASGFKNHLIGDASCQEFITLESDWRYMNGIIFPAHFSASPKIAQDSGFSEDFRSKTGGLLNRDNLLGWDAFNFLSVALRSPGILSPRGICRTLLEVGEFDGERINLEFDGNDRINKAMYILVFENGNFKELKSPHDVVKAYLQ